MIKDVFVLKKNSWHTKLMKRIWGWNYYDFSNMCPYFWLTVFNVLISPFIILYDVVVLIVKKISDFVITHLDALSKAYEKMCNEKRERWYNSYLDKLNNIIFKGEISDEEYELIHKIMVADYDKKSKFHNFYHNKLSLEKKECLIDLYYKKRSELRKNRSEIEHKLCELKVAKEKNNRQKIAKVLPIVKVIVKVLGVIALLLIVFLLYKLILIVAGWNWLNILKKFGIIIGGILIIGILGVIFWHTFKFLIKIVVKLWCVFGKYCVPCEKNRYRINKIFNVLGDAFAYPFIKIKNSIVFLWELLVTLKRNNCPGIKWED